jgi:hypothetical protein
MNTSQRYSQNALLLSSSALGQDEDVDGFIGHLEATLNYALARSTMIGITANYTYDDIVPVYVPPVYPAAGTGSAATFATEGQSSMTYGLRVVGRF